MNTTKHVTLFDPASRDLAEHFLADEPTQPEGIHEARVVSLAMAIQDAVEAWIDDEPS